MLTIQTHFFMPLEQALCPVTHHSMCLPRSVSKERFCLGWENSLAHEVLAAVAWECEIKFPRPHEATVICNPSTKWKSASGEFLKTRGPSSLSCMKLSNNNNNNKNKVENENLLHTPLWPSCVCQPSHMDMPMDHTCIPHTPSHIPHIHIGTHMHSSAHKVLLLRIFLSH